MIENEERTETPIINRGTGAGGANTNYNGKSFEEKTNNTQRLLEQGYVSHDYYISKTFEDKTVVFVLQSGLKKYIKKEYNIELFRYPDEAYIIKYANGRKVVKILEKKTQHVNGSVETKLWSGSSLKREYEIVLGPDFEVYYGFCVSNFLQKKLISDKLKYTTLKTILNENNIEVLFGDDDDYFEKHDAWLRRP